MIKKIFITGMAVAAAFLLVSSVTAVPHIVSTTHTQALSKCHPERNLWITKKDILEKIPSLTQKQLDTLISKTQSLLDFNRLESLTDNIWSQLKEKFGQHFIDKLKNVNLQSNPADTLGIGAGLLFAFIAYLIGSGGAAAIYVISMILTGFEFGAVLANLWIQFWFVAMIVLFIAGLFFGPF